MEHLGYLKTHADDIDEAAAGCRPGVCGLHYVSYLLQHMFSGNTALLSVYARIFNFPHDLKTMFFLDPAQIFPDHRIAVMCHIHAFDPAAGSRLVLMR